VSLCFATFGPGRCSLRCLKTAKVYSKFTIFACASGMPWLKSSPRYSVPPEHDNRDMTNDVPGNRNKSTRKSEIAGLSRVGKEWY